MPVVVAVPKHPILKLTAAGLAFKPNPPKLNPPAVVFPGPRPPNPAAIAGRQQEREWHGEVNWQKVKVSKCLLIVKTVVKFYFLITCFVQDVFALPVLVDPKPNPVDGAAAVVVAAPKPGAVRAKKQKQKWMKQVYLKNSRHKSSASFCYVLRKTQYYH